MKTVKEYAEFAKKVIALAKQMDEIFGDKYRDEHLMLAIMAGLREMDNSPK